MRFFGAIVCFFLAQAIYAQKLHLEAVYYNFSASHKPIVHDKNILIIKGNQSVSYTVPYAFIGAGVKDIPTNDQTIKKVLIQDIDTVKKYVYKDALLQVLNFEVLDKMLFKERKTYSDTLHGFNWMISGEVKVIDSFSCIKATATWRGRNYTAWFTESIPVSNGPWKFGGLPGLIVEIYDADKVSYWRLAQIRKNPDFLFPPFPQKTDGTFSDFKAEFYKKYVRVKRSIEGNDSVSDPNCAGCTGSTTFTVNTPERLSEQ